MEMRTGLDQLKRDQWKIMISRLDSRSDNGRLWKITMSMDERERKVSSLCQIGRHRPTDKVRAKVLLKQEVYKSRVHNKEKDYRNKYRCSLDEYEERSKEGNRTVFKLRNLENALGEMHERKMGGLDYVEIAFLKHLPDYAKRTLLHVINRSFFESRTPATWRKATLIPTPKPGAKHRFRPTSLASTIALLAEKMIIKIFMRWLDQILPPQQAGIRMNSTMEEQVTDLCEDIINGWNKKQQTVERFCDFSTAYNTVPPHQLMVKLAQRNCPVFLWRWIRAFIMDRRRRCWWNTALSGERSIRQGLPQGGTFFTGL